MGHNVDGSEGFLLSLCFQLAMYKVDTEIICHLAVDF